MAYAEKTVFGICLAVVCAWPVQARVEGGEIDCGSLKDAQGIDSGGPYDYRTAPPEKRHQVDKPYLQILAIQSRDKQGRAKIASDLDATLRLFPNHPQALTAMAELARQEHTDHPQGARYSMGCWYERAVRFAPGDVPVRLAYGYWLAKKGERKAALAHLDQVSAEALESPTLSYNLGLAYFEAEEYDKALKAAHRSYALGNTLPGLRNRLLSAGKWREPGAGKKPVIPVSDKAAN